MSFIFLRNRVTGGAAFTPASLFASGEEGVWYEPSTTTCFTDTAGTTAASVGNAVARINDLSGNGNHATQTNPDARPLLQQTAGGLYYLEFDGTDDFLGTGVTVSTGNKSAFIGVNHAAKDQLFFGQTSTNRFYIAFLTNASQNTVGFAENGAEQVGSVISTNTDYVVGAVDTSKSVVGRLNGAVDITDTYTGTSGGQTLEIGRAGGSGTLYGEGRVYPAIYIDRALTAQEISDTEAYLAAKSGVTL